MYGIFMGDTFQKLQQAADIPADVAMKVPILTMTGCHELLVENYRGIIEYTSKMIRVQTKTGLLKICGSQLNIDYYTCEEMKVVGNICQINWVLAESRGVL